MLDKSIIDHIVKSCPWRVSNLYEPFVENGYIFPYLYEKVDKKMFVSTEDSDVAFSIISGEKPDWIDEKRFRYALSKAVVEVKRFSMIHPGILDMVIAVPPRYSDPMVSFDEDVPFGFTSTDHSGLRDMSVIMHYKKVKMIIVERYCDFISELYAHNIFNKEQVGDYFVILNY